MGDRRRTDWLESKRALAPVRVLVPAQRLRAEELPLAVVAREHARRLSRGRHGLRAPAAAVAVGGARLGGGGAATVSDRSRVTAGQEEELEASWLLMSDS
jgi:hypothetical protein